MPDQMQAIVATPSGEGWTERRSVPVPEPEASEALVAVRAFSINRGELTLLRSRDDGWQPGQDVAGVVARGAADGSGPPEGARVAGLAEWHGWAEYVGVPTERLAEIPDGVDDAQAAALPMAGTTALNLLRLGGSLLGKRVLVTGGAGGVGHFAVQLAGLAGARATAVTASPERAERLRSLGLPGLAVVASAGEAEGPFDLVLESVGGESLAEAISSVGPGGTVVLFGNSSREKTPIEFYDFLPGGAGASLRTYLSGMHAQLAGENLELLLSSVAEGALSVEIGWHDSWERLEEALDLLEARKVTGKAVATIDR